jgi:hypothetical protein
LTYHTIAKARVHGSPLKLRPEDTPADGDPDVLLFRPQPIPVTWFARLHGALAERDYTLARRAIRELRTLGYSVVALGPRAKADGGTR